MTPVNVLVAFYSRYGKAEQLALAAGVGAIQTRANIRLRRVADLAEAKLIQADSEWTTYLDRMNRDYVVPRPADPVWADVINHYTNYRMLLHDVETVSGVLQPAETWRDVATIVYEVEQR